MRVAVVALRQLHLHIPKQGTECLRPLKVENWFAFLLHKFIWKFLFYFVCKTNTCCPRRSTTPASRLESRGTRPGSRPGRFQTERTGPGPPDGGPVSVNPPGCPRPPLHSLESAGRYRSAARPSAFLSPIKASPARPGPGQGSPTRRRGLARPRRPAVGRRMFGPRGSPGTRARGKSCSAKSACRIRDLSHSSEIFRPSSDLSAWRKNNPSPKVQNKPRRLRLPGSHPLETRRGSAGLKLHRIQSVKKKAISS